ALRGLGRRRPRCDEHTQNILPEKDRKSPHSRDSRISIPASPCRLRKDGGSNTAGYTHWTLWCVCPRQIPCSYLLNLANSCLRHGVIFQQNESLKSFSLMEISLWEKIFAPCEL